MSPNESTEYNGPENNEVYEDNETYESFDDMDEDYEDEPDQPPQSALSSDAEDFADEDETNEKKAREIRKGKDAAKKVRGQKSDDMEALDSDDESEESEDSEEDPAEKKEKESEEDEADKEVVEEKEEEKKPKGKASYVHVNGETFSLDSQAEISVQVDGKNTKVPLQELKNNYAGKVAYDKKFNEINLKEQNFKRETETFSQKLNSFNGVKQKIDEIIKDSSKNPLDALKIFLDSAGVDSYDLTERVFKTQLAELSNVLGMDVNERKAYFLERKNSHLLEQQQKRSEQDQTVQRVTSYQQQVDALRKSNGVSEAQYVDALEELRGYGAKDEELSEHQIVEWAATKPHRAEVSTALAPYKDQFDEGDYGELSWKLAHILRSGKEDITTIKKNLAEVYGTPTEVKELSKKLNPLGRKSRTPVTTASKKQAFESFDDIDEE